MFCAVKIIKSSKLSQEMDFLMCGENTKTIAIRLIQVTTIPAWNAKSAKNRLSLRQPFHGNRGPLSRSRTDCANVTHLINGNR